MASGAGRIKLGKYIWESRASLITEVVKSLPLMWETRVRSLGQEDPLEKEMATLSRILPGKYREQKNLVHRVVKESEMDWLNKQQQQHENRTTKIYSCLIGI